MTGFETLMLWVHFVSIGVGGAASFGIPIVAAAMPAAAPEARPGLGALANRLSIFGRSALAVLIVTGIVMVAIGPGFGGVNGWFWVKMVLVAALIAGIATGLHQAKRGREGDAAAAARARQVGLANIGVYVAILLAAILSFR